MQYLALKVDVEVRMSLVPAFMQMYEFRTFRPWYDFYHRIKDSYFLPKSVEDDIFSWASRDVSTSLPFGNVEENVLTDLGWSYVNTFDNTTATWRFVTSVPRISSVGWFIKHIMNFIVWKSHCLETYDGTNHYRYEFDRSMCRFTVKQ